MPITPIQSNNFLRNLEKLRQLNQSYPDNVKLFKPNSLKNINSAVKIVLNDLPQLGLLYELTDGFSLLDYCFLSISNTKISKLSDINLIHSINGSFRTLIVTSTGDHFGYTLSQRGQISIGHFNSVDQEDIYWLTDSIEFFLDSLFHEAEVLLETTRDEFTIQRNGWPRNIDYWLKYEPSFL